MSAHPTEDLAVLALGVLSPEESAPVRAHLVACDVCRAEFTELNGTAAVLAAAGPAMYAAEPVHDDVAASDLTVARVRRAVRAEQTLNRPRRVAALAGIAAAVLAFGGLGSAALQSIPDASGVLAAPVLPVAGAVELTGTDAATGTTGEATVEPAAGWVRLGLTLSGVEPGVRCRVTVLTTAGERVDAGSWTTATPRKGVPGRPVAAAAAVPLEDVARVEVETFAGKPLVALAVRTAAG